MSNQYFFAYMLLMELLSYREYSGKVLSKSFYGSSVVQQMQRWPLEIALLSRKKYSNFYELPQNCLPFTPLPQIEKICLFENEDHCYLSFVLERWRSLLLWNSFGHANCILKQVNHLSNCLQLGTQIFSPLFGPSSTLYVER